MKKIKSGEKRITIENVKLKKTDNMCHDHCHDHCHEH